VRQIQFIDDVTVSSAARPLYAVLVSREIEADQSLLNDDGLSPEEREKVKEEKEAVKTKRQVEADLGGFEMEQEWVEEIEHDDYFEVDTSLGKAPPLPKKVFEVWLVDAASGWSVLDSHQLNEVEHGASMEVMSLSEVSCLNNPALSRSEVVELIELKKCSIISCKSSIYAFAASPAHSRNKNLLGSLSPRQF
jgi:cleavage and polyadenylation specificity factor subunit 1